MGEMAQSVKYFFTDWQIQYKQDRTSLGRGEHYTQHAERGGFLKLMASQSSPEDEFQAQFQIQWTEPILKGKVSRQVVVHTFNPRAREEHKTGGDRSQSVCSHAEDSGSI